MWWYDSQDLESRLDQTVRALEKEYKNEVAGVESEV